jgi:hypothetical protein
MEPRKMENQMEAAQTPKEVPSYSKLSCEEGQPFITHIRNKGKCMWENETQQFPPRTIVNN